MSDPVSVDAFRGWLGQFAETIAANKELLTKLDSPIGDADHGINMHRGMQAVMDKIGGERSENPGELFKTVGMTLVSTVGGASGPLYGTFFLRFGTALGNNATATPEDVAKAFRAGLDGIVARGKAEAGDKTMFDALSPAVDTLEHRLGEGMDLGPALVAAADAADDGRDATIDMLARKGRASYLGERSIGHQDPGATSAAMLMRTAADTLS